jgi:hypothetical protein
VVALLADAVRGPGDHKGRFYTEECGSVTAGATVALQSALL